MANNNVRTNNPDNELRISIESYKEAVEALNAIHRNHPRVIGSTVNLDDAIENQTEVIVHRIEVERDFIIDCADEDLSNFVPDVVKFRKELVQMGAIIHSEKIEIARARDFIKKWNNL